MSPTCLQGKWVSACRVDLGRGFWADVLAQRLKQTGQSVLYPVHGQFLAFSAGWEAASGVATSRVGVTRLSVVDGDRGRFRESKRRAAA